MNAVRPLRETADTVTLRRNDFDALAAAAQDAAGIAAAQSHHAQESTLGWAAARDLCYTGDETRRLLAGATPLHIWRARRGLSNRALAARAKLSPSYLAEIESAAKPGSLLAWRALSIALAVPLETLLPIEIQP